MKNTITTRFRKKTTKYIFLPILLIVLLAHTSRITIEGTIPNQSYPTGEVGKIISPQMSTKHMNQPIVFDGYAILTGNGVHEVWDISNPYNPAYIKTFSSSHSNGECESHQVTMHRDRDNRYYLATTSGIGFDIWDITDATNPIYVKDVRVPNINYGDVDNGVWGLSWQGNYMYVGATNQGVYVIDISDMQNPVVKAQVPMTMLGGVKSGPVFAIGGLLVVTSPKDNTGVATIDISNPESPIALDYVKPSDNSSYIGGFYGKNAVVINPVRFYDVTSDPHNIQLVGTKTTPKSEYVSFDEGKLFLGGLRGHAPGIRIFDLANITNIQEKLYIQGRDPRWDDQFSCPIGNLVLIADDQRVNNQFVGAVLAVHEANRNTKGPTIMYTNPAPNATNVSINTSVGISLSDWLEFTSVDETSFIVRKKDSGETIEGTWSWLYTTLSFSPNTPLEINTEYDVLLTSGITDLVGNQILENYQFSFTTGSNTTVVYNSPDITGNEPTLLSNNVTWTINNPSNNVLYEWAVDGNIIGMGNQITPQFDEIGRYQGCVKVYEKKDVVGQKMYEAESGFFSSGAGSFSSQNAGYTGAGYMDFSSNQGDNRYLEWQIESPTDAVANIRFRYANGGSAARPLNLIVNGQTIHTIPFPSTNAWTNYNNTAWFNEISLNEGLNSIRLVANAGAEGGNIDNLQLDIKSRISHVREAEVGQLNGGVVIANQHTGYRGGGYVDFPSTQGANVNVTWTINNAANSNTKLTFRYANGATANRPLNLRVNGGSPIRVNFPSTGNWTSWQTVTTGDINLNTGSNTIVLSADAGSEGGNIDQISFTTLEGAVGKLQETKCFIQVIYQNTETKPKSSSLITKHGNLIWNVNPDAGTVSAIDRNTHTKAYEVTVGKTPRSIAVVGNNLWVVNRDSWNISVINSNTGNVINTYELPYASQPNAIVVSHDQQFAYISLRATGEVLKIATANGEIENSLTLGNGEVEEAPQIGAMALDATGQQLLVTRFISQRDYAEVYEVNTQTMLSGNVIHLYSSTTPDANNSSRGIPNYIEGITINPNGKEAWVASKKDNIERGQFLDGMFLDHETTVRAITSRIDLDTKTDILEKRIDIDDTERCNSVTFNNHGDIAFVTFPGNNKVAVLDTKTGLKITEFLTGKIPDGSVFDEGTKKLFVHNFLSRSISIVDVSKLLDGTGPEEKLSEISVVQNEPLAPQILLGKQLFYDASSKKLNQNGYMSCASCHLDGGHDGMTWDFTSLGEGFRNTIDLRGRAGTKHGRLHWTANFDEVHDFENQIREFGTGDGLMSDHDFNLTKEPLGLSKAGYSADLDALAAYVTSLESVPNSPYRNPDGTLTDNAIQGRLVFQANNCQSCHSGVVFTDSPSDVMHDIGTIKESSGTRIGEQLNGIDTPTLLGVWNTAPYLHDGSAATLKDAVLAHTSISLVGDIDLLVEYLRQIDNHDNNSLITANEMMKGKSSVSVYPNPVADHITISGVKLGDKITIYNNLGVVLLNEVAIGDQQSMDVSTLSPGVYTVRIAGKTSVHWVKK